MPDIGKCLAAFADLPKEERERSIHLINAYNDAVAESRATNAPADRHSEPFSRDEIEHLVKDYRADRLSNIKPAMKRYLSLLDRGYRWPSL